MHTEASTRIPARTPRHRVSKNMMGWMVWRRGRQGKCGQSIRPMPATAVGILNDSTHDMRRIAVDFVEVLACQAPCDRSLRLLPDIRPGALLLAGRRMTRDDPCFRLKPHIPPDDVARLPHARSSRLFGPFCATTAHIAVDAIHVRLQRWHRSHSVDIRLAVLRTDGSQRFATLAVLATASAHAT